VAKKEKPMNQNSNTDMGSPRIAFVKARWHGDIVDSSYHAFVSHMNELTGGNATIDAIDVPGAFEIPLLARDLARTGNYDAIVGAALVVDGGIYRHEFVAETVVSGLMHAQMETVVPMLSAVLTPHNFHDSAEHKQFFLDHFKVKGREVADACHSILNIRAEIGIAA